MFQNEKYVELYDIIKDPAETVNLMFDRNFSAIAGELITELAAYMKNSGDRLSLPADLQQHFIQTYKNGIQKSDKSQ